MTKIDMNQTLLSAVKECAALHLKKGETRRGRLKYTANVGDYGANCAVLRSDGTFDNASGLCHVSLRYKDSKENIVAIVTFPLTLREIELGEGVKEGINYPEGFLDDYYTWLSTTPMLEGVFLEPWNGEWLTINPAAPANLVLFACIASRMPTEVIGWGVKKEWIALVEGGLGWPLSLLIVDGFKAGLTITNRRTYSVGEIQGTGHSLFNRYKMPTLSCAAVAQEIPISKVKGAVISGSYNQDGIATQVFDIYQRRDGKPVDPDPLSQASRLIINYKEEGEGFGKTYKFNNKVKDYMGQFLPHALKWKEELLSIDYLKQEKGSE